MKSRGNHSLMRIYVAQTEPTNKANLGEFGSYGLSSKTNLHTIPWF